MKRKKREDERKGNEQFEQRAEKGTPETHGEGKEARPEEEQGRQEEGGQDASFILFAFYLLGFRLLLIF